MSSSDDSTMRGPIAWMAGHKVASNLVMLACIIGGLLMVKRIRQEVFPEIDLDSIVISIAYPGTSPTEVERGVVLPIEQAVEGLEGVKHVTSSAAEGRATITVEAMTGTDVDRLANDVKNEVDRLSTLPVEAEAPTISIATRKNQVLRLALHGQTDIGTLHTWAERARSALQADPGITQVELSGVPPVEIAIDVPLANLQRYGLTLNDIANRVGAGSGEVAGGGIDAAQGEILLRVDERRDLATEFADIPVVTGSDGAAVTLGQIATLHDGYEDTGVSNFYDGEPAIFILVYRVGDQSPISISDASKSVIESFQAELPPGLTLSTDTDDSTVFRDRVNLLLRNGMIGLVLVLIILGLFLEPRLAFWVMMGVPISFIGSFLFLGYTDVSINMISLFAYLMVLGIVVDDAIVVGENIFHYRQLGMPPMQAAITGAREVAVPVTFSILTNIAMFIPLAMVPGMMGKLFRIIPTIVAIVFVISLVESLFVLPAHLAHLKSQPRSRLFAFVLRWQGAFSRGFQRFVAGVFGPLLQLALRWRYAVTAAMAAVLLIVAGWAASGRMGFSLMPKTEMDFAIAELALPYGSSAARTEAIARQVAAGIHTVVAESGHPELLDHVSIEIGGSGSHMATVRATLADAKTRKEIMGTEEFTRRWRSAVGDLTGIDYVTYKSDFGGPSAGPAITVELSHSDTAVLEAASSALAATLAQYPRVQDVNDGYQPGKPQLDFTVRPAGSLLGLTADEIGRQVRQGFYGAEARRLQRERDEVKVMVRLAETDRQSEATLGRLLIHTPHGTWVPLGTVTEMVRGRAYTTIDRRDGRRVVDVTADIDPKSAAGTVIADLKATVLPELARRYPGLHFGFEGSQAEQAESLGALKVGFVLGLLAVYALLALPFRSYWQPAIVMVSIPFGMIGALVGHLIMGYDLSIMSVFGIVALSGVVVNDALVLVDFANSERSLGTPAKERIYQAGIQRFRPVILTTLTTFFGLTPMIFETSMQARFLIPMVLSLGFGVLFATIITLFLVPCLYVIEEDIRTALSRLFGSSPSPTPALPLATAEA